MLHPCKYSSDVEMSLGVSVPKFDSPPKGNESIFELEMVVGVLLMLLETAFPQRIEYFRLVLIIRYFYGFLKILLCVDEVAHFHQAKSSSVVVLTNVGNV